MAKVKHVERTYVKSEFRPLPKVNGVDRAPSRVVAVRRHDRLEGNGRGGPLAKVGGESPGPPLPHVLRLSRWLVHTSNMADGSTLREANQTGVLAADS